MKKLILFTLLLMAFVFSIDIGNNKDNNNVMLTSQSVTLEHKEAYKLDDGEYKSAVATKSNFGGESNAGVGLFTLFIALSGFFARNKEKLMQIGGAGLLVMFAFVNVEAAISLAIFPIIVKQLTPKEGSNGDSETEKLLAGIAEKNLAAIKEQVKSEMANALKGALTAEQLVAKLKELGIESKTIVELTDAITKQGEWMRKQETINVGKNGYKSNISKAFAAEGLVEKISKVYDNKAGAVNILGGKDEFENKVVGNITTANVTTDTGGNAILDLINADDLAGMNLRDPWIDQYSTVTRSARPVYTYVDYIPGEGDAAFLAESAAKSQVDLDIVVKTVVPKKVAAYEIMSEEAITDIPRLESEANNLILKRVLLKRQAKILAGTGINDEPNGVINQAAAFSAASWTGDKVTDVNLYDLIVAGANQIYNAHNYTDEVAYYPNLAVVNPSDLAALKLKKNEFGMYLFPAFQLVGSNGQTIIVDGITVLPKRDITAGNMLMGDFTKLRIINYIDYNVKMGFINDQFIKNLFTMLGETRFYTVIRNLDKKAFLYDTFVNIANGIKAV